MKKLANMTITNELVSDGGKVRGLNPESYLLGKELATALKGELKGIGKLTFQEPFALPTAEFKVWDETELFVFNVLLDGKTTFLGLVYVDAENEDLIVSKVLNYDNKKNPGQSIEFYELPDGFNIEWTFWYDLFSRAKNEITIEVRSERTEKPKKAKKEVVSRLGIDLAEIAYLEALEEREWETANN